jgi:hypothetical protein
MKDLQVPVMFEQLAQGLRKPYVMELPPRSVDERYDLNLENASEGEVLQAIVKLDPSFAYEQRDGVLLLFPAGEEGKASPFLAKVEIFRSSGGAGAAIRDAVTAGGLATTTTVTIDRAGESRPVTIDVKGQTVRDLLAEIARQAHLGMNNEPGYVRAYSAPE